MRLYNVITLLRPHQWVKNGFVFLPLFFDRHLLDMEYLVPAVVAFLAFCFAASGIYCFNDIYDVEADRKHPKKCKRPVASGAISIPLAYSIMGLCFIFSLSTLEIGGAIIPNLEKTFVHQLYYDTKSKLPYNNGFQQVAQSEVSNIIKIMQNNHDFVLYDFSNHEEFKKALLNNGYDIVFEDKDFTIYSASQNS